MNYVFTLVHGTFARGAAWTAPQSALRSTLAAAFPDSEFAVFLWTGKNTHEARLAAGMEFGDFLRSLTTRFPNSRHVIIAHSHGGNVAMYALRDENLAAQLSEVVCMATPFINCAPRDFRATTRALRWCLPIFVWFAEIFVGAMIAISLSTVVFDRYGVGYATIVLLSCLALYVLLPFFQPMFPLRQWVETGFQKWIQMKQTTLVQRLTLPRLNVPLLCARVEYDEAKLYLTLFSRAGSVPQRLYDMVVPLLWPAVIAAGVSIAIGFILDVLLNTQGFLGATIGADFAMFLFEAALLVVLVQILLALFPLAVRSNPLVFGWEGLFDNFLGGYRTDEHSSKQQ